MILSKDVGFSDFLLLSFFALNKLRFGPFVLVLLWLLFWALLFAQMWFFRFFLSYPAINMFAWPKSGPFVLGNEGEGGHTICYITSLPKQVV